MTRILAALSIAGLGMVSCATKPEPGPLRYATPVPGRPGFVISPYQPFAGYVDARGMAPGKVVVDPYSGGEFRVPPVPPSEVLLPLAHGPTPIVPKARPLDRLWGSIWKRDFGSSWGYMPPRVDDSALFIVEGERSSGPTK